MGDIPASLAVREAEVRSERIVTGQAAARTRGRRWSGSLKGRRTKVTSDQMATIERLRADGRPVTTIARTVGLSRPTIYALLRS